ncbi:MAG: protein-tyrosine phosphatase family protein [Pseudonocardiaceae bacterium]
MTEPLTGAIVLPDGTPIRGRGRREPLPAGLLPEFGLYLGRPPGQPRRTLFGRLFGRPPEWRPDWPADWIDWPDFRTPRDDRLAAAGIEHAYLLARAGRRVEVACGGGTGRTGTVIACMAVLAGHPAPDAVAWTRRHYRRRAVETPGQRRWIRWFATHVYFP